MKKLNKLLAILFLMSGIWASNAQTITKNVLTAPCNCNGEIEFTYSGFTTYPLYLEYYLNGQWSWKMLYTTKDTFKNVCLGKIYIAAWPPATSWIRATFSDSNNIFTVTNLKIKHAVCPGLGSIGATVTGGISPLTYSCIEKTSGSIVSTSNPASVSGGIYIFRVTDSKGCTYDIDSQAPNGGRDIYIYDSSNITYSVSRTDASCTNGSATITGLTGGIAPYSYLWGNGANTSSINGLVQGSYQVTVTDSRGCKSVSYYDINQNPQITTNYTATPATCVQSDGALIAFGSGGQNPYSYLWSTGATTQSISGLKGGAYSFTVTDKNGCRGIGDPIVPKSTPITVTYSATPSSCTSATGSATLNIAGGTVPYNVNWNITPTASGTSITNRPEGNYGFEVKDNVGCVQSGDVYIPPISKPSVTGYVTNAICPSNNGAISIMASGVAPLSYSWAHGSSSQNLSGLASGHYQLTVQDKNSCKTLKSFGVNNSPGFGVGYNTTNTSCKFSKDGSAMAIPSPSSLGPFSYAWSHGATTQTASNLGVGKYFVKVKAANGCQYYSNCNDIVIDNNATSDACYCTIKGKVYHDANNNCTLDASETGIENIMMHLNGHGYSFTDANGDYSFQAPTGTYTLSQEVKSIYPMSSCQTKTYTVNVTASSGCTQTFNFADSLIPTHDLFLATMSESGSAIVPGEIYTQRVLIKNLGNVVEANGKIGYSHDNQLTLNSTTSTLAMTTSTRIDQSSSFPSLNPGGIVNNLINYVVPTNIPINTKIIFQDTVAKAIPLVTEWLEDMSPWNNVNYYTGVVVSSYDPNSKEVIPQGTGEKGIIPKETQQLTYTIHFQNLGTYFAKKVELIDTLDLDLDIGSLTPIASSHKFTTNVNENGVISFLFDKIYLPCEKDGGKASNGFITYAINLKKDLAIGTEIKNFADIYFDYNTPVRTNTAINTIEKIATAPSAVTDIVDELEFSLYPNPASERFNISVKSQKSAEDASMSIYDLTGKQIYLWTGRLIKGVNSKEYTTENIPSGIYIINLNMNGEKLERKLVIEK